jgi:peptidoglycan-associated lipoprotein
MLSEIVFLHSTKEEKTMKRSRWIVLSVGLAVALMVSGCAKRVDTVKIEKPGIEEVKPPEGIGRDEGEVIPEDIYPIQPKDVQDVYFEFDRFDLAADARATLADNAAWLEVNPGATVQIEGHCDDRGTNEYNIALGDRRAKSVYNYLINLGVSPSRLSAISYGEEKPQCRAQTEKCWAKNRRSHFVVK